MKKLKSTKLWPSAGQETQPELTFDKSQALDQARMDLVADLFNDDPRGPELNDLRTGVSPWWTEDPALLALLDDQRWSEVEKVFTQARQILGYFSSLGPRHAGMPRRFGRIASAIFGMNASRLLIDRHKEEWQQEFFDGAEQKLRWAAELCNQLHAPAGDLDYREIEATMIEGEGLSPELFQIRCAQIKKDLRRLMPLIWSQIETSRPRPALFFYNRFKLPGIDTSLASPLAVYQPRYARRERIVFSLALANLYQSAPLHRLPAMTSELPLTKLLAWEPCLKWATFDYDLLSALIHETTHALAHKSAQAPVAPRYKKVIKDFCAEQGVEPASIDLIGLELMGKNNLAICPGLGFLDEVLTEAAALEIKEKIEAQIPASLKIKRTDPWLALSPIHPYRGGLRLITEFLPNQSPLAVLTGPQTLKKLMEGIQKRLSKAAAKRITKLLFNRLLFLDEDGLMLATLIEGPHKAFYDLLFRIIAEDDARTTQ